MTSPAMFARAHGKRAARFLERRDDPQPSSTASVPIDNAVPMKLSSSVKALAGIITVLALIILGIAAWKLMKWRRKRKANSLSNFVHVDASSTDKNKSDLEASPQTFGMEKPSRVILTVDDPSTPGAIAGWVPQVPKFHVANPTYPEPSRKSRFGKPSFSASRWGWDKAFSMHVSGNASSASQKSPPPAYVDKPQPQPQPQSQSQSQRHLAPTPPPQGHLPSLPPLPPVPQDPPAKLTIESHPYTSGTGGLRSPARSSSFSPRNSDRFSKSSRKSEKKLPRLMVVAVAFVPTLEDELPITVGDTIRLLEEYEDEWCLVQRVGRLDAEKGVVPRLCLRERVDPLQNAGRRHKSGLSLGQPLYK